MDKRTFKNEVYGHLSTIGQALGNARRMEILDLLANGEKTVEKIARETGLSIANASQHLQVLKAARLVSRRREGNFIHYSLANPEVYAAWLALRQLGNTLSIELRHTLEAFRNSASSSPGISLTGVDPSNIQLIDVRPAEEYAAGHIPNARSIPLEELPEHLDSLPRDKHLIAYCRGPFCVFADEAVQLLRNKGFSASRLEEGYAEWALKN